MYILLASMEFKSLTGQPMYNYNLAKGLMELGHEVTCVGLMIGNEMEQMLKEAGVKVFKSIESFKWEKFYDLAIISECFPEYLDHIYADKIYNFCHSKDIADKPIIDPRIDGYLAPREQVADYWKEKLGVDFKIMPIPINFERFNLKKEKQDKYIILAPCTRCLLREPMLLDLIKRADDNTEVWMVGDDLGALQGIKLPDNVKIFPRTTKIEEYMKKADEVAGIFIGTVTLEAWAMGLKTSVYDEEGNWKYVDKPEDFEKYNYKNVAKQIINLI